MFIIFYLLFLYLSCGLDDRSVRSVIGSGNNIDNMNEVVSLLWIQLYTKWSDYELLLLMCKSSVFQKSSESLWL